MNTVGQTTLTDAERRLRDFERSLYLLDYDVLRSTCMNVYTQLKSKAFTERLLTLNAFDTIDACVQDLAYLYNNGVIDEDLNIVS